MGTEYKVGTISQLLAQSSGGGATKADPKLAALFKGASAPSVFRTVKVSESSIFQKKSSPNAEASPVQIKKSKDKKKVKEALKIKDALAAVAVTSEKSQKKLKTKIPKAAPVVTSTTESVGKIKKLKKKLKRLNSVQEGTISSTVSAPSSASDKSKKKKEKKNKLNAANETGKVNGVHDQVKHKAKNVKGEEPVSKPRPMSASQLAKKELKKNKRKERRLKEENEKLQALKQEEKVAAADSDEDSDADEVKVEPGLAPQSNGEPKTLEERNAPKPKNNEQEARTIFVGNLPPVTKKKELRKIFMKFGTIDTIRFRCAAPNKPFVLKKVAINKKELHPDNETLAAYIRFSTIEEAQKAAAESRGMLFHDHHLTIDVADQGKKKDPKLAIFVGNLSLKLKDEELWRFFEDCGSIISVRIVRDNATGMGKGFGYVNFEDRESVNNAITKKNQEELNNRQIRISRCVKKLKVKKEKFQGKGRGGRINRSGVKQEGRAPGSRTNVEGRWKGQQNSVQDKKYPKVQKRIGGEAKEYSGDQLAEIGKLKRKSHKPNKGELRKANIVRLLTHGVFPNKKKTFK